MAVSKVIYDGNTLVDLTGDTVAPDKMLDGTTAHDKTGTPIKGGIASQAAQTITPGTTDQIIAAGKYLSGAQTIKGDANLKAANIKSGVSIFGVAGTVEEGVTVQRTTGSFTTNTSGSASVSCGFKPDLVVFYTHTSYNRNVPMWASFPFEESGETKLAIAHAPTTKNYNSYVYAETECTQTSTGFSVYIRNLSQSLSFSNASRASFDYIAIKYTN